jgi:hypothetical protein
MRTVPRHITICSRLTHGAVPRETSATEEPAASTSPRASAGHHPLNTSADGGGEAPSVLLVDGPPGTPFMWHRVLPVLRSRGV